MAKMTKTQPAWCFTYRGSIPAKTPREMVAASDKVAEILRQLQTAFPGAEIELAHEGAGRMDVKAG
jgi:hypothetical protein